MAGRTNKPLSYQIKMFPVVHGSSEQCDQNKLTHVKNDFEFI